MIKGFRGPHRFLSNFVDAPVLHPEDHTYYISVEHAYQASKTLDPKKRVKFWSGGLTAGQAKRAGSGLDLRADWNEAKIPLMTALVRDKFTRHSTFREKLLATGAETIVEFNTWGDTFWGVVEQDGKLTGTNHMGEILMLVRKELRDAYNRGTR